MMQLEEMREQLSLGELPVELTSNANIRPGELIPVVTDAESRKVELFKWGLVPYWAKDESTGYKMINARAETLADKPSFRQAFLKRRCLIPADGFYEWSGEGKERKPYLFTLKEQTPFMFAGLWEVWRENLFTCTIITTEPNDLLSDYHNRMPVILKRDTCWQWLKSSNDEELKSLLQPLPVDLMAAPVQLNKL